MVYAYSLLSMRVHGVFAQLYLHNEPKKRVLSMGFMHVLVHPLGLVNKQNTGIWCRFENVIKYRNGILQETSIGFWISTPMVLLVWHLYYNDVILMIAIQTGPIYTIENTTRNEYIKYILVFNSNNRIGFKIPMPTSCNIHLSQQEERTYMYAMVLFHQSTSKKGLFWGNLTFFVAVDGNLVRFFKGKRVTKLIGWEQLYRGQTSCCDWALPYLWVCE